MTLTKRLRNEGEAAVRVEYCGDVHHFDAGAEREVPADLADSAQYRYSHLGIKIVNPGAKEPKGVKLADAVLFVDEEAKVAAEEAKADAAEDAATSKAAKADARADAKAEAAEARAERKAAKATPHPDDLSAEFAPELPQRYPVPTTAHATAGSEIAVDRHEEPAWSPPAESPTDPPPTVHDGGGDAFENRPGFVSAKPDQTKRKK